MLVLSRDVLESIMAVVPPSANPTTIKITVLEIRRCGRTRLGFDTEREVVIDREEVWKNKQDQGTTEPDGANDGPADQASRATEEPLAASPGEVEPVPPL